MIGHTLYTVTTVFNPASKESLSDTLKAPKASVRYSFNDAFPCSDSPFPR
ncbi:MAG: transposon-encoded TnpW family protein [Ruminococcus sp.]|nr:transposon-encoded TnpW family protein [Ruminococcus sp.]